MGVEFYKYPEGEVIALFPNTSEGENLISSYMHNGQHGAASEGLRQSLEPCDYCEYKDLLKELISIGYKGLSIQTMQEVTAHRQPTAGEIRLGYGAIHYADINIDLFINKKTGGLKSRIKLDGLRFYR